MWYFLASHDASLASLQRVTRSMSTPTIENELLMSGINKYWRTEAPRNMMHEI